MKVPDKIYLWRTGDYISKGWKQKQTNINHDIEYIRKDALLDWLKAVKADVMIPMNIDRVIAKIESL